MKKVAVVTGANRGLGLGTAEQLAAMGYEVAMVGRSAEKIAAAAHKLREKGLKHVAPFTADVTRTEQVDRLAEELKKRYDHIDVLINNAGAVAEKARFSESTLDAVTPEEVLETLNINAVGPYRVTRALLPLLQKSPAPRIVNVSSGMGQLSEMGRGYPAYRISKTALNGFTTLLHAELKELGFKVNAVCPGWVRTDMGGPNATRSIEEGVKGIVWAATLPESGPSGGFFRDGKPLPW